MHRPHLDTHSRLAFVDTNIASTLNLLEAGAAADLESFVFTSTMSVFGRRARLPPVGAPAVWMTDEIKPIPQTRATDRRSAPDLVPERPLNDPEAPYRRWCVSAVERA